MEVNANFDRDTIEDLAHRIELLIAQQPALGHTEILTALIFAICDVVLPIQCKDCRTLTAKNIKHDLRELLGRALIEASRRYANAPAGHTH